MIEFNCFECETLYNVDLIYAGRKCKCKGCATILTVPQPDIEPIPSNSVNHTDLETKSFTKELSNEKIVEQDEQIPPHTNHSKNEFQSSAPTINSTTLLEKLRVTLIQKYDVEQCEIKELDGNEILFANFKVNEGRKQPILINNNNNQRLRDHITIQSCVGVDADINLIIEAFDSYENNIPRSDFSLRCSRQLGSTDSAINLQTSRNLKFCSMEELQELCFDLACAADELEKDLFSSDINPIYLNSDNSTPQPKTIYDLDALASVPYLVTEKIYFSNPDDIFELSLDELGNALETIVYNESPIHFECLSQRVLEFTNTSRAGSRIRAKFDTCLRSLYTQSRVQLSDGFFTKPDQEINFYRNRERQKGSFKKLEYIHPKEIKSAIMHYCSQKKMCSISECISEVSTCFGFKRTTAGMTDRIKSLILELVDDDNLNFDHHILTCSTSR